MNDAQLPLPQEAIEEIKIWTEEQIPVGPELPSVDRTTTLASTSVAATPDPDWKALYERAEDDKRELNEKLKKLRKKLATIESDKAASDDLALRYSKKLLDLEDKQKIPTARFTTNPEFNVTVEQLREINERCATDSMFVGMLCIQLLGVDHLKRMSVTGQPSHRFINAKAADGSPICKTTEKMHPTVVNFICDKVAERTAIRVGAENVATIRKHSDIKAVNRFIATKISNLRKASGNPSNNQGTSRSIPDEN
nr:uncharacterized protein LOC109430621 [Aedes albopictus]XP_029729053.1 uncharacterized protein LOC109430621 [Aedes albopictus]